MYGVLQINIKFIDQLGVGVRGRGGRKKVIDIWPSLTQVTSSFVLASYVCVFVCVCVCVCVCV